MDSKEYKKLASNKDEDESFLDYGTLSDEEKRQKGSNDGLLERATYTSSDLLFQIGFGKSQVLLLTLLSFAYMAQYNMVTMMPYLSTRLYVDMDLSPSLESSLGVASYAGFAVSYPFWGLVADKFGRRWSLLLASFWILFWNALYVLSPSISWVVAFRLMYSLAGGKIAYINITIRKKFEFDVLCLLSRQNFITSRFLLPKNWDRSNTPKLRAV